MVRITLKSETVGALRVYKTGGKTWDEVVKEFIEHSAPPRTPRARAGHGRQPKDLSALVGIVTHGGDAVESKRQSQRRPVSPR